MSIISREVIIGASLEYGRAVLLQHEITFSTAVIPWVDTNNGTLYIINLERKYS